MCNVVLADKVYCSDVKYMVAVSGQTQSNLKKHTPTMPQKHTKHNGN